MKKIILACAICLMMAVSVQAADVFPDLDLVGPMTDAHRTYLGVSNDTPKVSDIQSDYLFVEGYSMYCPICQRDAPEVNEMYETVKEMGLSDRLKFIGIGTGNTPFEVAFYRKKYGVEFPLFEDPEFIAHKALGGIGTPAFYLVDLKDGKREILFFQEGEIKDKEVLLNTILGLIDDK